MGKSLSRKVFFRIGLYISIIFILAAALFPYLWLIISSISTNNELLSVPPHWIPREPTLKRYISIFSGQKVAFSGTEISSPSSDFKKAGLNSLIVSLTTTIICLFIGTLSSYAFARLRFLFKNHLFFLIIVTQMLPPIATIIPLYFIVRHLGIINTRLVLVLIYSSFTLVYVIWVMTNYFKSIPMELEEAARIDGCSRLGAVFKVILPISTPGLVAAGILSFIMNWSEFMFALIFTNTISAKTLPVTIAEFSTQFGIDYGMMTTGGVIASIPPIILVLIFQKYIVFGLTKGALKG